MLKMGDKVTVKEPVSAYADPTVLLEPGKVAVIAQTFQPKVKGTKTYALDFKVPGKILPGGSETWRGTTNFDNLRAV
jgi:hypothetical protein